MSKRLATFAGAAAVIAVSLAVAWPTSARAGESLVGSGELGQTLSVEELKLEGDQVTGILVNRTEKVARDVRLQVIFSWLWKNEKHPGDNDPSFVVTEIPTAEVPPHGTLPFRYTYPSVVTARSDGEFMMDARVLGYSAVGTTQIRQPQ